MRDRVSPTHRELTVPPLPPALRTFLEAGGWKEGCRYQGPGEHELTSTRITSASQSINTLIHTVQPFYPKALPASRVQSIYPRVSILQAIMMTAIRPFHSAFSLNRTSRKGTQERIGESLSFPFLSLLSLGLVPVSVRSKPLLGYLCTSCKAPTCNYAQCNQSTDPSLSRVTIHDNMHRRRPPPPCEGGAPIQAMAHAGTSEPLGIRPSSPLSPPLLCNSNLLLSISNPVIAFLLHPIVRPKALLSSSSITSITSIACITRPSSDISPHLAALLRHIRFHPSFSPQTQPTTSH